MHARSLSSSVSRALSASRAKAEVTLRRLSTGVRVGRASEGAAELARIHSLNGQIRGLQAGQRSLNQGISLLRTGEGGLRSQMDLLQRMRELAVQHASESYSTSDRAMIQAEFDSHRLELDRIAEQTQYNGRSLLNGTSPSINLQVGPTSSDALTLSLPTSKSVNLGTIHELSTASYNANIVLVDQDAFMAGDLLLGGVPIWATTAGDDSTSSNGPAASAIAKAQAINDGTASHGVTATINPTVVTGASAVATFAIAAGFTTINDVDIGAVNVLANDADGALRTAINAVSDQTGVVAALSSANRLVLTAEDGRNIKTSNTSLVAFIGGRVYISSLNLRADRAIEIGGADPGKVGLSGGETSSQQATLFSSGLAGEGGVTAIEVIDVAIQQLGQQQAEVGALLARVEHGIDSVGAAVENAQAARGWIRDADFAAEAARWSRHQTLQSASASLLAQANVESRQAFALLAQTLRQT